MPDMPAHRLPPRRRPGLLPPLRSVSPADLSHYTPAVTGVGALIGSAVFADLWASRTKRPTISAFVAEVSRHPVGGPVVVGVIAGLVHHLVLDPMIRRLEP